LDGSDFPLCFKWTAHLLEHKADPIREAASRVRRFGPEVVWVIVRPEGRELVPKVRHACLPALVRFPRCDIVTLGRGTQTLRQLGELAGVDHDALLEVEDGGECAHLVRQERPRHRRAG